MDKIPTGTDHISIEFELNFFHPGPPGLTLSTNS